MRQWEWLVGLLGAVVLAFLFPQVGSALYQPVIVSLLVAFLFGASGMRISFRQLAKSVLDAQFHLLAFLLIFAVTPPLIWLLAMPIESVAVRRGVIILGCLPTTISSCAALSALYKSDEAAALLSAVASNLMAVILTPVLLAQLLPTKLGLVIDPAELVVRLIFLVLLPFVGGQLLRQLIPAVQEWDKGAIRIGGWVIFTLVFLSFSRVWTSVPTTLLLSWTTVYVAFIALVVLLLLFLVSYFLVEKSQRAALAFVGSQKTLALGFPLVMMIDHGVGGAVALMPMLIYHFVQLLLPGLLYALLGSRLSVD